MQREPHPKEHGEGVQIEYAYAAPTDVAAYREMTFSDAVNLIKCVLGENRSWADCAEMHKALQGIHAVIRIPAVAGK